MTQKASTQNNDLPNSISDVQLSSSLLSRSRISLHLSSDTHVFLVRLFSRRTLISCAPCFLCSNSVILYVFGSYQHICIRAYESLFKRIREFPCLALELTDVLKL